MIEIPDLMTTAEDMLDLGYKIFPLPPLCKTPTNRDNLDSLAETNGEVITIMWQDDTSVITAPEDLPEMANIGIDCGKSHLLVIDIDVKNGDGVQEFARFCAAHKADWPETFTVKTASGGYHLYFKDSRGFKNTRGRISKNIDTRGVGGYVVGWGSVVLRSGEIHSYDIIHDTDVCELPEWLTEALEGLENSDPVDFKSTNMEHLKRRFMDSEQAQKQIDGIMNFLAGVTDGGRNEALHWAACRFGELAAAGKITESEALMICESACDANGLSADDGDYSVRATFRSGFSTGYGTGE